MDPRRAVRLFPFRYQVCMAKKGKAQQQDPWIWVEGRGFDHRGVRQWYPLFNHRSEAEANSTLKLIERGLIDLKANRALGRYDSFRVSPSRDHLGDMNKERAKADAGRCPNCKKKPGKHTPGQWKGYRALRCSRCGHTWAISNHQDHDRRWLPSYVLSHAPERPVEAIEEGSGSRGAKKKGKKGAKSKKKSKKKSK